MIPLLLAWLAQGIPEPAPFRSEIRIEESLPGSDAVTVTTAAVAVHSGGTFSIERPGQRPRRRSIREAGVDPQRFQVLELWALPVSEWSRIFEASAETPASERPLPERVVDADGRARPPIRATPPALSLAKGEPVPAAPSLEGIRLVPRDPELRRRFTSLTAWVEKEGGRIARVEATAGERRQVFLQTSRREERRP